MIKKSNEMAKIVTAKSQHVLLFLRADHRSLHSDRYLAGGGLEQVPMGQKTQSPGWKVSLPCPHEVGMPSASKGKRQEKRPHPPSAEDTLEALGTKECMFSPPAHRASRRIKKIQTKLSSLGVQQPSHPRTPFFLRLLRSI